MSETGKLKSTTNMKTSIPRDQLLESLREQSLEIPDLRPLFQHWPQAVNPHLERLKSVIPSKLARSVLQDQNTSVQLLTTASQCL